MVLILWHKQSIMSVSMVAEADRKRGVPKSILAPFFLAGIVLCIVSVPLSLYFPQNQGHVRSPSTAHLLMLCPAHPQLPRSTQASEQQEGEQAHGHCPCPTATAAAGGGPGPFGELIVEIQGIAGLLREY